MYDVPVVELLSHRKPLVVVVHPQHSTPTAALCCYSYYYCYHYYYYYYYYYYYHYYYYYYSYSYYYYYYYYYYHHHYYYCYCCCCYCYCYYCCRYYYYCYSTSTLLPILLPPPPPLQQTVASLWLTSPVLARIAVCSLPAVTSTMSLPVQKSERVGVRRSIVSPSPSSPAAFCPN